MSEVPSKQSQLTAEVQRLAGACDSRVPGVEHRYTDARCAERATLLASVSEDEVYPSFSA